MHIAISNALALLSWHGFEFLHGAFTDGGSVWWLIGVILAVVAIIVLAMEAALFLDAPHRLQCRAGWSANVTESTSAVPPSHAGSDGSSNVT
ncbi:MAG: hypothetical protein WAK26_05455 [Terracidiphilus sp.]